MKIYVAHSSAHDFKKELYEPLQKSPAFGAHVFVFPHSGELVDSKEILSTCDLVIAEVSHPSTGLGIELGWANDLGKKVVCIHKVGTTPSSSLRFICSRFLSYSSDAELIDRVQSAIA